MESCGHCRRLLRWDESASACLIPGYGSCRACPDCYAAAVGQPPPERQRYPWGTPLPRQAGGNGWGGGDPPVCGLCRRSLHSHNECKPLRLRAEMLVGYEGIEPGGYAACRECRDEWQPKVYEWLVKYSPEILPPTFSLESCNGNWLA